jgi:hypothetical protein
MNCGLSGELLESTTEITAILQRYGASGSPDLTSSGSNGSRNLLLELAPHVPLARALPGLTQFFLA